MERNSKSHPARDRPTITPPPSPADLLHPPGVLGITLLKALEIMELNAKEAGKKMPSDTLAALNLLIEAGRYVKGTRYQSPSHQAPRLPGEAL